MSRVASFFVRQVGRAAARRFDAATRDPAATQQRKLLEILRRNQDTEYGRRYGFGSIGSLAEYRERVPVVSYDEIKPYMDRVVRGEAKVLTAEAPVMFAQTSGTTGYPKYIPVTPTCQGRDHKDQMRTWFAHALRDHPGAFRGKVVSLVSPAVEGHTESGLPFGSASGHIYKNMPVAARGSYAIPYDVFLIQDYEAKYYTLMRIAVASDVTMVGTANPSSILKMCEIADRNADGLVRDVADGTLRADLEIDPELRGRIERRLRPKPARARRLEEARRRRGGRLLPADYWPGLVLIGCWKGGTVGSYIERFPDWFDPDGRGMVPIRDWGYLSSEARGSIPLSDRGSAGVLTVATNVFEFVEREELEQSPEERESWRFRSVAELEQGQEYYVFFTTTGGLYRYDINDVIKVMGRYNETPTVVFLRKGRGMTNITGEKLSVNQVIAAFENVSKEMGIAIDHYKAEADQRGSRYILKVEAPGLDPDSRRPLLGALDRELSRLNIEYETKRKSLRLNPPLLQVMRQGWYDEQKRKLVASGKRLFQAKTILLEAKDEKEDDGESVEAVVEIEQA